MRRLALKSANTRYVVFLICWFVAIKRSKRAKLPFVPAAEKTWEAWMLAKSLTNCWRKSAAEVFINWRNKVLKAENEFNRRVLIALTKRFARKKFASQASMASRLVLSV